MQLLANGAHQDNLKTVVRPNPADPRNQNRCQTTAARLSELNARHATTSIFVQWRCVHVQLSSKLVDQRATIMVTRPCFAAADQQQTEHRALALRDVIADDLVTKKCAAMKKHSSRSRQLVSVDNPKCHGTLLLEVGTQNSGGTVCLFGTQQSWHRSLIRPRRFLNSCRAHVASYASLTTCLCQQDQDSSFLARSRCLGAFQ